MKIEPIGPPVAGSFFNFSVSHEFGEEGSINIIAEINGSFVTSLRCPDPPCHEMSVFIEEGSGDRYIRIIAESSMGTREALDLRIRPSSTPSSSASPAM